MAEAKSTLVADLTFLWQLSSLSDDDFDALFAEVSAVHPSPRIGVLSDAVRPEYETLVLALGRLATNLLLDEDELRDLLTDHIEEITELPSSNVLDEQMARAVDRSLKLLNSRPIQLQASSTNLRLAHERTFLTAGIVTDLRPILDEDPETGDPQVVAVLRRHNLSVMTLDHNRNRCKQYFVLDDEDLAFFASVLQSALAIIPALDQLAEQNNIIDLSLS